MIDDLHRQLACILRFIDRRYHMQMSEPVNRDVRAALDAYDDALAAEYREAERVAEMMGKDGAV